MLNRKGNKASAAKAAARRSQEPAAEKARPVRHRFIISSKSAMQSRAQTEENRAANGPSKTANGHGKPAPAPKNANAKNPGSKNPAAKDPNAPAPNPTFTSASQVDLTETIKTLLGLQQENGYVTYDDINDILPDNLSPDDLDELYTEASAAWMWRLWTRRKWNARSRRRRKKTRTPALRFWMTRSG